jgi:hypothetical protein
MLGELFTKLVDAMKLAGELGLLLRLEQIVRMPGKGQLELLAPPEERIHSTLLRFLNATGTEPAHPPSPFRRRCRSRLALLELAGKTIRRGPDESALRGLRRRCQEGIRESVSADEKRSLRRVRRARY